MKRPPALVPSLAACLLSPCLLALVLGGLANAATLVERAARDEAVSVPADDAAMRKAFDAARSKLDEFLGKLRAPPAGIGGFAVKVGVRAGSDLEYLRVGKLSIDGDRLSGRIDNEPRTVKTLRAGDTFAFARGDIVDWLYIDRPRRRMHGNFTACALMAREPPKEAATLRKRLGLSCKA
jgi:uncharacterized protein YegJ (DUF2314 family)